MRLRMLKTVMGSEDGAATRPFKAGEVYQLGSTTRSAELAKVFLREGWAELEVVEHQVVPPLEVAAPPLRETIAPVKPGKRGRG